jgi:hypothetical protein
MSVQFDSSRNRWVVRWYEPGRQPSRRFAFEATARAFDAECHEVKAAARDATVARLGIQQVCELHHSTPGPAAVTSEARLDQDAMTIESLLRGRW